MRVHKLRTRTDSIGGLSEQGPPIHWLALTHCDDGYVAVGLTSEMNLVLECPEKFFHVIKLDWNTLNSAQLNYQQAGSALLASLLKNRGHYDAFAFHRKGEEGTTEGEWAFFLYCPPSPIGTQEQYSLYTRIRSDHTETLTSVHFRQVTRHSGEQDYLGVVGDLRSRGFYVTIFKDKNWWLDPRGVWLSGSGNNVAGHNLSRNLRFSLPDNDGRTYYFTTEMIYVHQLQPNNAPNFCPELIRLKPGGRILDVYPTPEHRNLYVSAGGVVKVYDLRTNTLEKTYKWIPGIKKLMMSPDCLTMAGLTSKQMIMWDVD